MEVISFTLLFRFNKYQGSVFFTSCNYVTGKVYEASGSISSYFHLKTVNEDLLDKNIVLEQEVAILQRALAELTADSTEVVRLKGTVLQDYSLFKANVVNNSLNKIDNYITLDKGETEGIRSEMGVLSGNGVAGIVYMASRHYSVVISLLNSKSSISCKIKGSDYFGYLKWEGGDSQYAYVKDLPRHSKFNLGDTVVTSGYSTVFPAGIMIGTIDDMSDSHDGLSYLLKVKLSTDFGKLSDVRVITKKHQEEQMKLEKQVDKQ